MVDNNKLNLLSSQLGENRLKKDIDISEHLTSAKGSKVPAFYLATTSHELVQVILLCRELKIKYLLVGSGSKTSISDFDGVIIKNRSHNIRIFGIKGAIVQGGLKLESAFLEVDSGVSFNYLIEYADKQRLTGLDIFKDVPGTLGGNFFSHPAILQKADLVKILSSDDELENKAPFEVKIGDTIVSITFKLKAKV